MNKKYIVIVSLVFVLTLLLATFSPKPTRSNNPVQTITWKKYTYDKQKFSVQFPTIPSWKTTKVSIGNTNKQALWVSYVSELSNIAFRVDVITVPEEIPLDTSQKTLLSFAKYMMALTAPTAPSNPISTRFLTYLGHPAIEYDFKNEEVNTSSKFLTLLVDQAVYTIGMTAQNKHFEDYKKFISTFKL